MSKGNQLLLKFVNTDSDPMCTLEHVLILLVLLTVSLIVQVRPPDDTIYVRFATKNPKKTRWVFHGELLKFYLHITHTIGPVQNGTSRIKLRTLHRFRFIAHEIDSNSVKCQF